MNEPIKYIEYDEALSIYNKIDATTHYGMCCCRNGL